MLTISFKHFELNFFVRQIRELLKLFQIPHKHPTYEYQGSKPKYFTLVLGPTGIREGMEKGWGTYSPITN